MKRARRIAFLIGWEFLSWKSMGVTGLWAGFILFGVIAWVAYTAMDLWHDLTGWLGSKGNSTTVVNNNLNVEQARRGDPTGPTVDEWGAIVEVRRELKP